ncbi:hypothetical protein Q8G71_36100, partial [Klebsiella pneumoniae]
DAQFAPYDPGKGFLFQHMMLMIKMLFGEDILEKAHANHLHMRSQQEKYMVKIDTSALFG